MSTPVYPVIDRTHNSPLSHAIEDYPAGFLLTIDKPYRWTSADVVRKVKFTLKRHFRHEIKVGHAGTLDPLATGVLVICAGKTTKIAESLQAEKKEYVAGITLGATTPSFDLEKEIDATYPFEHVTRESVEELLKKMTGPQEQYPPIFSAKYIDGTRAYEKARLGEDVELKPAHIEIYDMELLDFELPVIRVRVECSKGTYIRALARDIGTALGSGGHLSSLRRTASGGFRVEECLDMDTFTEIYREK